MGCDTRRDNPAPSPGSVDDLGLLASGVRRSWEGAELGD